VLGIETVDMKRYRIVGFDFDTRVRFFDPISEAWEEQVKAMHRENRDSTIAGLKSEFGEFRFEEKLQNFVDLGAKPFSVLAFHNLFYAQARSAFVQCQYYPALTGVCALGERVLNHLVLGLRGHFKASASYKHVYRKDSFDRWEVAIDALAEWDVLTTDAEEHFRQLCKLRNNALHFNLETERNVRNDALNALLTFGKVVDTQFAALGQLPWLFMPPGEVYIRKAWEARPFVRLVYVPNAIHVGPMHQIVSVFPWRVADPHEYEQVEVSDEEFTRLRLAASAA
jgi:hypothetical protein